MASDFTITDSIAGDVVVLRVTGRLDARNAQVLMQKCRAARETGHGRLVLNLREITFVASSGIGTLLALTEEFQETGGGVHLVSLSDAVTSVVELLNLTQFLAIEETESAALQAIGA